MTDKPTPTVEIYKPAASDVRTCKERSCRRPIVWAKYLKSGKVAPMDHPLTVLEEFEREGGGAILLVENRNHFITCTRPKQFNKPRLTSPQGARR